MKSLRAIFGILVIVGAFYLGWMIIPPYFHAYQFEDVVAEQARLGTYSNKSEDDIKQIISQKAQELDLPVQPDQVKVNKGYNMLEISVDYTVHVDLPAYPLDLKFSASSKNRGM